MIVCTDAQNVFSFLCHLWNCSQWVHQIICQTSSTIPLSERPRYRWKRDIWCMDNWHFVYTGLPPQTLPTCSLTHHQKLLLKPGKRIIILFRTFSPFPVCTQLARRVEKVGHPLTFQMEIAHMQIRETSDNHGLFRALPPSSLARKWYGAPFPFCGFASYDHPKIVRS